MHIFHVVILKLQTVRSSGRGSGGGDEESGMGRKLGSAQD